MVALTRWSPFDELARWNPFDNGGSLFPREFWTRLRPSELDVEWSPRCDVTELENELVVHAELPGVAEKDLSVTVEGACLSVRGEKRSEKIEKEKGKTYSERFFGSFERRIPIPEGVDQAKIEARLKDGILEIHVPIPAATRPEAKKIEIKVS